MILSIKDVEEIREAWRAGEAGKEENEWIFVELLEAKQRQNTTALQTGDNPAEYKL